ncbi:MAG: hypothetical protein ACLFQ5_07755, partial [Oceanicaulis sp.]
MAGSDGPDGPSLARFAPVSTRRQATRAGAPANQLHHPPLASAKIDGSDAKEQQNLAHPIGFEPMTSAFGG